MFKSIGISIGAFLSNPLKFVGDPANAVIEYQTKKMAAEGKTVAEIEEALKEVGLLKGAGPVKVVLDGIGKTLDFTLKNLPAILLLALVAVIAFYSLRVFKVAR